MASRKSTTHRLSIAPWSSKATARGVAESKSGGAKRGAGESARSSIGGVAAARASEQDDGPRSTRSDAERRSTTIERKPRAQERERESYRESVEYEGQGKNAHAANQEIEESFNDVGGESQVDIARITEEYQARRTAKSAAEREAFTRSARLPFENLIVRIERDFEQDEDHLNTLFQPFIQALEISGIKDRGGYLDASHQRGGESSRTTSHIEQVTDRLLPRIAADLRVDLATFEDRLVILRREKKRLLAQAQKRVKNQLESQKLVADATALLNSYTAMFAHYREPQSVNGGPSTPSKRGGSSKKAARALGSGSSRAAQKTRNLNVHNA